MRSGPRAPDVDELLHLAQAGDVKALGELFALSRRLLTPLARARVNQRLQGKADASDLVQAALLEAHRHFPQFRGTTEAEYASWLRRILAALAANQARRYLGTKQRDARLEHALTHELNNTSCVLEYQLAAGSSSPSEQVIRREASSRLTDALKLLPEHYQQVIVLRHLQGLAFVEVARQMDRSVDSVEKLWVRALRQLREVLGGNS
jgi:RNA polymerase sigma-70 factor (ECF subfamily)